MSDNIGNTNDTAQPPNFLQALINAIPEGGLDISKTVKSHLEAQLGTGASAILNDKELDNLAGKKLEEVGVTGATKHLADGIITHDEAIAMFAELGNAINTDLEVSDSGLERAQALANQYDITDERTINSLARLEDTIQEVVGEIFDTLNDRINHASTFEGAAQPLPPTQHTPEGVGTIGPGQPGDSPNEVLKPGFAPI